MIKTLTYNQIDSQQWQTLVDQSPYATWFQTPEAYQFYASVSEMIPFVTAVENNGKLRAICVGYTTKETNAIKQYLTCRAIIIGGPLLVDDATDEEVATLLKAVTNAFTPYTLHPTPIYIESRNFHDYSKWRNIFEQCGFAYQPHYDIHVHCNAAHIMSEQRRRQLKKAIKNGAEICEAQSEQDIRDWYLILSQLYREKVRTPLFSVDFFLQFYSNKVCKYLLVKYEGKIIGGMMCPILEGKAIYEWYVCGADEEYKELYPSVVATHAAIEYAKTNGLPLFDFMGAGNPDEAYGVRDFKMEFGGELVEHGRYLCVRKPMLYWIGKMGVKWLKRK